MKHIIRWFFILICVAGIAYLAWHLTRPKPVKIMVKPVTRGTVERTVANTRAGTVKACRRAKMSPGIGGQITVLSVHEGDFVKSGQLLVELWNKDITAQLLQTRQQITASKAHARSICLRAEVARRNADRILSLRKSKVISEEQADNAVSEANQLKAECDAAKAEIEMREAQIDLIEANFERTRLVAPFDGVIAEINGELFEYVTPSPVGVPTPPVIDILDNTCFYVTAPIDEVDAAAIRIGMPVRISLDAFSKKWFDGHVSRIADFVLDLEKQARTVDVEAAFDNKDDFLNLLAGYSADIEVILEAHENVVRVPTEAVMEDRWVYIWQTATQTITKREIKIGIANWNETEVIEGIQPDEQVVINVDNPDLKDGVIAELMEEEE